MPQRGRFPCPQSSCCRKGYLTRKRNSLREVFISPCSLVQRARVHAVAVWLVAKPSAATQGFFCHVKLFTHSVKSSVMKNLGDGQSPTEAIAEAKAGFGSAPCQHKRAKPVQVRERPPAGRRGGGNKGTRGTGFAPAKARLFKKRGAKSLHPAGVWTLAGYPGALGASSPLPGTTCRRCSFAVVPADLS